MKKPVFYGTGGVDQFDNLDGYQMTGDDWANLHDALVSIINDDEPVWGIQIIEGLFIKAQESNDWKDGQNAKNEDNPLPVIAAGIVPTYEHDDFDDIPF